MGSIGENIKQYRKEKNISQKELSKKTDIHVSQLSRYEKNKSVPTLDNLLKISLALNVSVYQLDESLLSGDNKVDWNEYDKLPHVQERNARAQTSENIKKYRKEKGLTQKQLGEKVGISATQIGHYEQGFRKPKFDTLVKISNALEVNVSDIAGEECSMEPLFDADEINLLIDCIDIAICICNLSNSDEVSKQLDKVKKKIREYYK